MTLDFAKMNIDDLHLLKNEIDNQIYLRQEAEKQTKINAFKNAFMDLNKADISIYVAIPYNVLERGDSSFPLDWDDLMFN